MQSVVLAAVVGPLFRWIRRDLKVEERAREIERDLRVGALGEGEDTMDPGDESKRERLDECRDRYETNIRALGLLPLVFEILEFSAIFCRSV